MTRVLISLTGLEILAFPCNQFMKQEPGTSEDAQQFACTRFKAEYPIFKKVMREHLACTNLTSILTEDNALIWNISCGRMQSTFVCLFIPFQTGFFIVLFIL